MVTVSRCRRSEPERQHQHALLCIVSTTAPDSTMATLAKCELGLQQRQTRERNNKHSTPMSRHTVAVWPRWARAGSRVVMMVVSGPRPDRSPLSTLCELETERAETDAHDSADPRAVGSAWCSAECLSSARDRPELWRAGSVPLRGNGGPCEKAWSMEAPGERPGTGWARWVPREFTGGYSTLGRLKSEAGLWCWEGKSETDAGPSGLACIKG